MSQYRSARFFRFLRSIRRDGTQHANEPSQPLRGPTAGSEEVLAGPGENSPRVRTKGSLTLRPLTHLIPPCLDIEICVI